MGPSAFPHTAGPTYMPHLWEQTSSESLIAQAEAVRCSVVMCHHKEALPRVC